MADYTTYSAEELAAEPAFFRWVKEIEPEQQAFWEDWVERHPDKQELVEEARKLVLAMDFEEATLSDKQVKAMWQRLELAVREQEAKEADVRHLMPRWGYLSLAASILLILGILWVVSRPNPEVLLAQRGEQHTHTLPDGSTVTLNAESRVVYEEDDWDEQRLLTLRGEAFFDVKKGAPFIIETARGRVEVLGTSFNVLARGDQFDVGCYTGRVSVSAPGGEEQAITAGQGLRLKAGSLQPFSFDPQTQKDWRAGVLRFENAPLQRVLEEVARQYDVQLRLAADISGKTFGGSVATTTLDSVVMAICWPLNLEFERKNDTLIIKNP